MKAYVKPELFVERYELSQHIATCGIDMTYGEEQGCHGTLDPDFWGINDTVFNDVNAACSIDISTIEVYCYTVGTSEAGRTFVS